MRHLEHVQDALQSFLGTLLGGDAPLQIDAPIATKLSDAHPQTIAYLVVQPADASALAFGVMLDNNWMGALSQAMLGEAMQPGDDGADDLLTELAAQVYGSVRTALDAEGVALPELTTFSVRSPGQGLDKDAFPADLLEVPFALKRGDETLGGFALVPAPQPEKPKAAAQAPQAQRAAPVNVAPAAFQDLGGEQVGGDGGNFELLSDVELEIRVELGRRRLPLADALRLTTGSVVELEKLVGEPLEIYANGRLIAEGEAVVIDDQFGIRVTSLAYGRQRAKAFM